MDEILTRTCNNNKEPANNITKWYAYAKNNKERTI